eukprot:TRINITY_DN12180_c0_g1_i2.p1 TRINITY_DN12180_c0_g1~~TRINITY_DN12180_c0_g1_i2.p1  ORF type:complete len:249 (-),score=26.86 TRINITY_DN12180_c0_g1_i2:40-786(-)
MLEVPLTGTTFSNTQFNSRWSTPLLRSWMKCIRKDTFGANQKDDDAAEKPNKRQRSDVEDDINMRDENVVNHVDFGSAEGPRDRAQTPTLNEAVMNTPAVLGQQLEKHSSGVQIPLGEEMARGSSRRDTSRRISGLDLESSPQIPMNLDENFNTNVGLPSEENELSKHSSSLRGALSQFGFTETLQETDATQGRFPYSSIDKRTASLAGFFREQVFKQPDVTIVSLSQLLADCNRQQAARIFYQTCGN